MSNNLQVESHLLETVGNVRIKYEPVHREQRFNVFSVVRKGYEEVGLHSAMLYELLNPKGSHGHGPEFLRLFFEQFADSFWVLNPENEFSNASVRKEKSSDGGDDETGRIDIFIETENIICGVENKIYEEDRPGQLAKYYSYLVDRTTQHGDKKKRVLLIYLTLRGEKPTENISEESNLVLLSYEQHIHRWLSKCLERVALEPLIRESIRQYQILIERLTGNTMAAREKQEVIDEIGKSKETIDAARAVYKAWPEAIAQGVFKFWEELESYVVEMAGEQSIVPRQQEKYKWEKIKKLVETESVSQKRLKPFGLMFSVGMFDGDHVCIFIVTPWHREGIKYGITILSYDSTAPENSRRDINYERKYKSLVERIEENDLMPESDSRNDWWLASTIISDVPNMRYPQADNLVAQLMLPDFREKTIKAVMDMVEPLYNGVSSILAE